MKQHFAVILACAIAVAALAGCAVLYQTGARHEAALQDVSKTLDGVRSENAALQEELATAQKTIADLQAAQEKQAAALEAQKQKEREAQEIAAQRQAEASAQAASAPSASSSGQGENPQQSGGGSSGGMTQEERDRINAWLSQAGGSPARQEDNEHWR